MDRSYLTVFFEVGVVGARAICETVGRSRWRRMVGGNAEAGGAAMPSRAWSCGIDVMTKGSGFGGSWAHCSQNLAALCGTYSAAMMELILPSRSLALCFAGQSVRLDGS